MSSKSRVESGAQVQAKPPESVSAVQKSDMRKQMEEAIEEKITPQFNLVRAEMKTYFEELSKDIKAIRTAGGDSTPKP